MSNLLERLSADLALPSKDLIYLIRSAPHRYKVYEIAKRTPGEKRIIAQPAKEVKPLQYWVIRNVLANLPVHPSAMAYRTGKNILDNARPHASHKFLCKLDFKNFFPSITSTQFEKFMHRKTLPTTWTDEEIGYLSRILFWCKKRGSVLQLSIGAPSSPLLSNVMMYDFDLNLHTRCLQRGITYTRYADDLTFSTSQPGVLRELEGEVTDICREVKIPRLLLNETKTVHASKKGLRQVTGLVLANNGTVSIGRHKKRVMRATLHRYVRGLLSDRQIVELAGMISFIKSVEPTFIQRLGDTYGIEVLRHLQLTQKPLRKGSNSK